MKIDRKEGESYVGLLRNNKEMYGRLIGKDNKPYAEYVFKQLTDTPVQIDYCDPMTFTIELTWCHEYKLSRRQYNTSNWETTTFFERTDYDDEEAKKLAAYDRAMGII